MNGVHNLKYRTLKKLLSSKRPFRKNRKLYEEFLLDVVNSSNYFLSKSGCEKYRFPGSESNRECDCNSFGYKLDFKLIISNSYMEGISNASLSHTCLQDGVYLTHPGNKGLKREKLGKIYNQLSPSYKCEYKFDKDDIKHVENCLKICKHLLLFFPYEVSADDGRLVADENEINIMLTKNFVTTLIEFRKNYLDDYDTYFAYMYKSYIIINMMNKNGIWFVEKIGLEGNNFFMLL